jgi:hypothetical protein
MQGFLLRVPPIEPSRYAGFGRQAVIVTRRASLYFSIGLRWLFLFLPTVMWATLGATSLLIITVIEVLTFHACMHGW